VTRLETIRSLGDEHSRLLRNKCHINSISALLRAGATPRDRQVLAESIGVDPSLVLEWVRQADLAQIKGIGREYLGLLNAIGVETLDELGLQNPETLCQRMEETNGNEGLVNRLPTLEMVGDWVEQANEMSPVVKE
jgi:predicted flap endonuclease-1-like 5' DNA nuclease